MVAKRFGLSKKIKWVAGCSVGGILLFLCVTTTPIAIIALVSGYLSLDFGSGAIATGSILTLLLLLLVPLGTIFSAWFSWMLMKRSHITTSPAGIEYRYWPGVHIRADWEKIKALRRFNTLFLPLATLEVPDAENVGKQLFPVRTINLSYFDGWPDGELADEINKYAPRLLEE